MLGAGICLIVVGAVLLIMDVIYNEKTKPLGTIFGVICLVIAVWFVCYLVATPSGTIAQGEYEVVSASLAPVGEKNGPCSTDDAERVHMMIWIEGTTASNDCLEVRYFRFNKDAFSCPELLTPENLKRVTRIEVIETDGFKKIELVMKDTPKALPLEEK